MDITSERLSMRKQQPLTTEEVEAIITELLQHRDTSLIPNIPHHDVVQVPPSANHGDVIMIKGHPMRVVVDENCVMTNEDETLWRQGKRDGTWGPWQPLA